MVMQNVGSHEREDGHDFAKQVLLEHKYIKIKLSTSTKQQNNTMQKTEQAADNGEENKRFTRESFTLRRNYDVTIVGPSRKDVRLLALFKTILNLIDMK